MSNNMLAVQPPIQSSNKKITPNILPCRIRHDGPVAVSKRYWDPIFDGEKEGTHASSVRGSGSICTLASIWHLLFCVDKKTGPFSIQYILSFRIPSLLICVSNAQVVSFVA